MGLFSFLSLFQLQENKFRFSISYHVRSFYTTGEEVQTYPQGVSPVGTGVTHHRTYIVSTMYTPRPLLGALCVLHMKMLGNAFDSHVMEY